LPVIRVRLNVVGRVQGVFYRANTRREALSLGLTGWVRNLPDGSVEVVAEGEEDQVEKLISCCRRGPPLAIVRSVEVKRESPVNEFKTFSVRY
jgi:acylphosphatase